MKFTASTATFLSIVVASTSAASLRSSSNRELLMASPGMAAPAALSVDSKSIDNKKKQGRQGGRGSPSILEFVSGKCIGFDQETVGQQAIAVDCNEAPEFVYRDDYLLELYDNSNANYCLEASKDKILLRDCDDNQDEQKWFFTATVDKNKRVYRLFNYETKNFVERSNDKVTLQGKDTRDKDQLFVELDQDFLDTSN